MPTAPSSSSKSSYCCCGYLCCFFLWAPPGFLFICAQRWGLVRKWGQGCRFGPRSTRNSQKFVISCEFRFIFKLKINLSICSDLVLFFLFFWLGGSLCKVSLRSFSRGERRDEERFATRPAETEKQHLLNRQQVLHTLTVFSEITPYQGIKNSNPRGWHLCMRSLQIIFGKVWFYTSSTVLVWFM